MKESNIDFINAVTILKSMLNKKIISKSEFNKMEEVFANKYHLNKSSLYRESLDK